nr:unnamed protein product [Digitaria exilis]CAB3447891.1 unnamed protein product [Digitaria exilis]
MARATRVRVPDPHPKRPPACRSIWKDRSGGARRGGARGGGLKDGCVGSNRNLRRPRAPSGSERAIQGGGRRRAAVALPLLLACVVATGE